MALKVGSMNLAEAQLNSELKIMILERVVELLLENQARMGRQPDIDFEAIHQDSLKKLRDKYPDLRFKYEEDE